MLCLIGVLLGRNVALCWKRLKGTGKEKCVDGAWNDGAQTRTERACNNRGFRILAARGLAMEYVRIMDLYSQR